MAPNTNEFIPIFSIDRDPVPDLFIPPPLVGQSEAAFAPKLALVQKISETYEKIKVPRGSPKCSWCPMGVGYKHFTSWMQGLLHTMSYDALEQLFRDLEVLEDVCDNAKEFLLLGKCPSGNESIKGRHETQKPLISWGPVEKRGDWLASRRDHDTCVISKKVGAVRSTYIAPFNINSSPGATRLLLDLFFIPAHFFNDDVAVSLRAMELLTSNVASSDAEWNVITLNSHLSGLFDDGYIALRPLAITKKPREDTDRDGKDPDMYQVHFSVHYMPETISDSDGNHHLGRVHEHNIKTMHVRSNDFKGKAPRMSEIDAITKEIIYEGQEFSITHNSYENAENMFIMLAFRWAVNLALCLAGRIGAADVDNETDCDSEN